MKETKIAMLYICTGQYVVFWNDFYESFQSQFLPGCRKEYFVFTDKEDLCKKDNVHLILIPHRDWPYTTLMRFEFFLKVKEDLSMFDFIFFFNANMKCNRTIIEQEVLPNVAKGEKFTVAMHPLYHRTKSRHCPFERNLNSTAYVSYTNKSKYIMGSLNGGEAKAYLSMIVELAKNTRTDLEKGLVARVHDESHLNAFVSKQPQGAIRYLSPSYIYPMDLLPDYSAYILLLDKQIYFDVTKFKRCQRKKLFIRAFNKIGRYMYENIKYMVFCIKER